jgi:hypothetical protein
VIVGLNILTVIEVRRIADDNFGFVLVKIGSVL